MSHRNHFISCFWVCMAAIFHGNITQEVMDSNWEEVGRKPFETRSLGKAGLCCSGGSRRDKSRVTKGIMLSSAKRWCNKYLSFSSDGEVFDLRFYPEGELFNSCSTLVPGALWIWRYWFHFMQQIIIIGLKKYVCCFLPWLTMSFWAVLTGEALQISQCRTLDMRGNFQLRWEDT